MVIAGPPTRKRDEEERIILMKSRNRRALNFLSFSSSPDFSIKNIGIYNKYIIIYYHGRNYLK